MARTGVATAKFLEARGSIVTTTEAKSEEEMGEVVQELKGLGLLTEWGGTSNRDLYQAGPHCGKPRCGFEDRAYSEGNGKRDSGSQRD